MAKYIGVPLAICAIILQFIGFIDALEYDFSNSMCSLYTNALVAFHVNMDDMWVATLACPRHVNGTEYVWHPQPTADHDDTLKTYVIEDGKFRSVPFSSVVVTESPRSYGWKATNESQTDLHIDLMDDDIYAITEERLVFICGPRDVVLSDALQGQLARLREIYETDIYSWGSTTSLVGELSKTGKSLGVVFLHRGLNHQLLQGCGSRPSKLFARHNYVTVDPVTGTRSCVVNPMSTLRTGFVCEGRIEPNDCMKSLLDKGRVVTAPRPYLYRYFDIHEPWVVARYFNDVALPRFNGECRCIDPETGHVKARMEIRWKTEYVCDIASLIVRNRFKPIRGPWCSVMLHPDTTLTIKLPKQTDKSAATGEEYKEDVDDIEEDAFRVPFSQLPSIHAYETEFKPDASLIIRQIKTIYDIDLYDDILIHEAFTGDVLEVDVSQMERGEVKLKYRMDRPLALRSGYNSFLYHWTFLSRNENVLEKIRAVVNVSFAPTYRYNIIGCDRWRPSMFDPANDVGSLAIKDMGNGIGKIAEWLLNVVRGEEQAGIRCGPNEELLPNNCESTGYDLSSNQIAPFPTAVRNATLYPVRGFQVFEMSFHNVPVSHACSCVDVRGYETSRLILKSNRREEYEYTVSREDANQRLLPYLLLPLIDVAYVYGYSNLTASIMLHNIPQRPIKLQSGTEFFMRCVLDHTLYNGGNDAGATPTWFPYYPGYYHYKVDTTPEGSMLISMRNEDRIAGTKNGLEFIMLEHNNQYSDVTIKSHSDAILISMDPDHSKYVPMTFVCGKEFLEPEFLQFNDEDFGATIAQVLPPLEEYTWNVVQIDVEMTDPYMQGCGVTYGSDKLFKPETPKLYNVEGREIGCKIDIQAAGEAAFYCPAPYVLDPPNCFNQVYVNNEVKNLTEISKSLIASASSHFVTLPFDSELIGPGETLRQRPPLECRCVTIKGVILSTIQIENYYAK